MEKIRLLLVEDTPDGIKRAKQVFGTSFQISCVGTLEKALQTIELARVAHTEPEVVLTNLTLDHLRVARKEFIRAVRRALPQCVIIAWVNNITAWNLARACGADFGFYKYREYNGPSDFHTPMSRVYARRDIATANAPATGQQ
jgi:DNA-binding NarL/FixJ family response regulator